MNKFNNEFNGNEVKKLLGNYTNAKVFGFSGISHLRTNPELRRGFVNIEYDYIDEDRNGAEMQFLYYECNYKVHTFIE